MNISIHNIDLELQLSSQHKYANIENDIHQRFVDKVLRPLDKSLQKLNDVDDQSIRIDEIKIEEDIPNLRSLDTYFARLYSQIEGQIKNAIEVNATDKQSTFTMSPKQDAVEIFLRYIINGSAQNQLSKLDSQKTDYPSWEKVYNGLLQTNATLSLFSIVRITELFSYQELISSLEFKFDSPGLVFKTLLDFWQVDFENRNSASSGSLRNRLKNLLSQLRSSHRISKRTFKLVSLGLLLSQTELIVNKNELKTYLDSKIGKAKHKRRLSTELREEIKLDKATGKLDLTNQWSIKNAALILLHPFFKPLFENTACLDGNSILNYSKAIQLLNYLSTGNTKPKNYNLIIEKVLLGLNPNDTIVIDSALTKKDKSQCEELLAAVIKYWNALGNTSADGLRQLFLQRNGLLMRKGENWTIEIEGGAQDILLDKLPWGYSMIKLPWVEGVLHIQFTKS